MTKQEILNSTLSKSDKMRSLFELGFTRKQVSELLNCNYGFCQNVFAKKYGVGRTIIEMPINFLETFSFNHKFGIEIEAHGIEREVLVRKLTESGINATLGYRSSQSSDWKATTDSSICGTNTFELVSPILEGQDGIEQLKKVCQVLKKNNALINKTCGLHIHFDARQFELPIWKNLFMNYARLENVIDSFMVRSRRDSNNYYCQTMEIYNWESKIKAARDLREIWRAYGNERKHKMNVECFWRQGSVEFRHHSGSIDFEKISNWIFFLARLIEISKTKSFSTGTLETLREFCDVEIMNYIQTRIEKLNPAL